MVDFTPEIPGDRPIIATICGDAGTGKTSLAATFPKPIVIRTEDGLSAIPIGQRPPALPIVKCGQDIIDQLTWLISADHDYKTVIIDTVTSLEPIFIQDVLKQDGKVNSINQALGGWGAGKSAVINKHNSIRRAAGVLNEKRNMNVIFIAHSATENIRPPDSDDYQRWTLKMIDDKCVSPYVDNVDLVGFLRLVTYIKGDDGDRKKAVSTDERELVCTASAASVTKNRCVIKTIDDALPVKRGENPLVEYWPTILKAGTAKPAPTPATTTAKKETAK